MAKKQYGIKCPLLLAAGVADGEYGYDSESGEGKEWINDICLTCPLGKLGIECIFILRGKARREAKEKLEELLRDAVKSIGIKED